MFPTYTVTEVVTEPDQLRYVADRPWPVPRPQDQRIAIGNSDVVTFDANGKPSDIRHASSMAARERMQARRMTPKATPLSELV
jgi:hypothetical protein